MEIMSACSNLDVYWQRNIDVLDSANLPKRSDYGLPEDKFLFACFNQLYKMDPEIFSTWYVVAGACSVNVERVARFVAF